MKTDTLEAKIKSKWSRLTDGDIDELNGDLNRLSDKIQKVYGRPKSAADQEVAEFRKSLSGSPRAESSYHRNNKTEDAGL